MAEKKMTTKELEAKIWISNKIEKAKDGLARLGRWAMENPLDAITIGTVVGGGVWKGHRMMNDHKEEVKRQRSFYDRRRGYYVYAKRNLKPYERAQIDARYDNGESYNQILMDMNLIK